MVDEALTRVDLSGRTTRVARSVLAQMFAMAARHDALVSNPMREVRRPPRRRRAVQALTVEQARDLLRLTAPTRRVLLATSAACCGGARRTPDLHDVALCSWVQGCASARRSPWSGPTSTWTPTLLRTRGRHDGGASPRRRQRSGVRRWAPPPADDQDRRDPHIALPRRCCRDADRRRAGTPGQRDRHPVFLHAGGGWLWPNNVRTKLRGVVADTPLAGASPHTLRRTVGT